MIRVCIFDSPTVPAVWLAKLLNSQGFEAVVGKPGSLPPCDVVLASEKVDVGLPVVIYAKQLDLGKQIIEASVAHQFKPLNDSINKTLEMVRK